MRFQSAPPHGGRLSGEVFSIIAQNWCFNPRPRTGGDTYMCCAPMGLVGQKFQSAPPHGGRR